MHQQRVSRAKETPVGSRSAVQSKAGGDATLHPVHRLQKVVGNRAVQRMLAADSATGQARTEAGMLDATGLASAVDHGLGSPGASLDSETREFMESRFGQDFSTVRVHTDSAAATSSRAINANAYTIGQDIVFGAGKYAPGSSEGKRLIAHELTHVVQQFGSASASSQLGVSEPGDPSEQAAEEVASQMVSSSGGPGGVAAEASSTGPDAAAGQGPHATVSRDSDDDNSPMSNFTGPAIELAGDVGEVLGVPGAGLLASAAGTTKDAGETLEKPSLGSAAGAGVGLLNTTASLGGFGLGEAGGAAVGDLAGMSAAGELGTLGMAGPVGAVAGSLLAGMGVGRGMAGIADSSYTKTGAFGTDPDTGKPQSAMDWGSGWGTSVDKALGNTDPSILGGIAAGAGGIVGGIGGAVYGAGNWLADKL